MLSYKRLDASSKLLEFLIWAILSLFGTRIFLVVFDNPIIGRGDWHFAHVLWGGLFMLIGIIIFLVNYGKKSIKYASIFSGIGWGMFIDEIGKYVTSDNNYWFRPAIIFIYISFIILFLLYRFLERKTPPTKSSLWHELLESCQEIIDSDIEKKEKKEILKKIRNIEKLTPSSHELKILTDIRTWLESTIPLKDKAEFNLVKFIASSLQISYSRLFKKKVVYYSLIAYSFWYILDKLYDTVRLILNSNKLLLLQDYYRHYDFFSRADVYMISLKFIIEVLIATLYTIGLYFWLRKKTSKGIKFYQFGLLLNIFIGSIIKFYFEQFSAVLSLILALLLWSWLDNYRRERVLHTR
ncbi:MAG TPA: hypothetical protein VN174_04070 [Candidatus Methanoperedens sp.]|nr:hypothetical protein [Candidatus Methanoperedens sp.]